MKCEMCGCDTRNVVEIKNRLNGNELKICRSCAVQYGFIKMPPRTHWECKYCDSTSKSQSLHEEEGFYVCSRCGAEWEDCKILVDDEAY